MSYEVFREQCAKLIEDSCSGDEMHCCASFAVSLIDAIRALPLPKVKQEPVNFKPLSSKVVEQGWRDTFSVNNPYCPCDLRTFEKSVIWAERELGKKFEVLRKENERLCDEIATWKDAFSNLDQINKGVALKGGAA